MEACCSSAITHPEGSRFLKNVNARHERAKQAEEACANAR